MDEQNFNNDQQNHYQDYTADTQYQVSYENREPAKANGMQIASLVLGIIGIPACCCYGIPGVIFGLIGLILAIVGNSKNKGIGIGIAGLICSIISLLLGIAATAFYAMIIQAMLSGTGPYAEMLEQMGYKELFENMMQQAQ